MNRRLNRRTMLRGAGAAMALPLLEAMTPLRAVAATAAKATPLRLAWVFVPNGVNVERWTPEGESLAFSPTLEPLEKHRGKLALLEGLTHDKARANGDGGGDHARSAAAFLTGRQPVKTAGRDIRAGVSIDQVAAANLGHATSLPSLQIGCERGAQAGACDTGYSCAYSSTICWSNPNTPVPHEVNPRGVFTRLFGDPSQAIDAREAAMKRAERRSILDLVLADATDLSRSLGRQDQDKLEEYLDSVRDVEKRIQGEEKLRRVELPPTAEVPHGIPERFAEHIRIQMDMLVLALQTDATRVATFMLANEGSNRPFPTLGIRGGHHELSHHQRDVSKMDSIAQIDRFYVERFAYLLEKLDSIPEADGTLLDHCMLVYGSAIADGNRHNHENLPVVIAGGAGGRFQGDRRLKYPRNTPMCNLYLDMLDAAGIEGVESFGDSTGRLGDLFG